VSPPDQGAAARHTPEWGRISSLVPAVARAHRALAGTLLQGLDLSPGQEKLLMLLWEREPRSQSEITRNLAVEPPTVVKMLTRMERAGVVVRGRSDTDGRIVLVSLTDKGRALEAPVRSVWEQLEEHTVAGLDPQEQEDLAALLEKVVHALVAERRPATVEQPASGDADRS
jgi:DNA-binding MarR family transcriptional regulator